MEPEQTPAEQPTSKFENLHKITPLSKYLAMVLFVILPFVGGYIGYKLALSTLYQDNLHTASNNSHPPAEIISNSSKDQVLRVNHLDVYQTAKKQEYYRTNNNPYDFMTVRFEVDDITQGTTTPESRLMLINYDASSRNDSVVSDDVWGLVKKQLAELGYETQGHSVTPFSVGRTKHPTSNVVGAPNMPIYLRYVTTAGSHNPYKKIVALYPDTLEIEVLETVSTAFGHFDEHIFWGQGHVIIKNNVSSIELLSLNTDEVYTLVDLSEEALATAAYCEWGCRGEMEFIDEDKGILRYAVYTKMPEPGSEEYTNRTPIEYREVSVLDFIQNINN